MDPEDAAIAILEAILAGDKAEARALLARHGPALDAEARQDFEEQLAGGGPVDEVAALDSAMDVLHLGGQPTSEPAAPKQAAEPAESPAAEAESPKGKEKERSGEAPPGSGP